MQLTLYEKIVLLLKISLLNLGILKVIWKAKRIPLNEYSKALLSDVDYKETGLFQYKSISDSTGEWRFYIPKLDKDAVYRIDTMLGYKSMLPDELHIIGLLEGRVDDERYNECWENGKTILENERYASQ